MSTPTPPGAGAYPAAGAHAAGPPLHDEYGHASDASDAPDVGGVSVGELVGKVTRDLSTLMRQELALAQAELKQEATRTGKAAGALVGAGFAAFFVVLFLSLALWAGLSNLMDAGWAGLIVALLWAVIGAVLFVIGRARLREVNPTPERTIETLSQVPEALKGQRGGTA